METEATNDRVLYRLQDVTFLDVFAGSATIREGSTTLVRGRSGSGKTTLLRMLNRMITPSAGRIVYRGKDVAEIAPIEIRRQVVMLAQTPVLFGGTVRDEAAAGRHMAAMAEADDATIRAALDAVQLSKQLGESPTSFSGGEKQRLCLARVLVMEPPVLLLDEPTVGLDRETEEAVFRCISNWQIAGRTVIAATHSEFTRVLGDVDVLELRDGRLIEETYR